MIAQIMSMILLGIVFGLPIGLGIVWLLKKRAERKEHKEIEQDIENGKILKPIDKRDYNYEEWKDHFVADPERVEQLGSVEYREDGRDYE